MVEVVSQCVVFGEVVQVAILHAQQVVDLVTEKDKMRKRFDLVHVTQ